MFEINLLPPCSKATVNSQTGGFSETSVSA